MNRVVNHPADRSGTARRPPAGAVVAAVLLPPLGVHLAAARRRDFWIGTALTALGLLPGIAFALHALLLRGKPAVGA